MSLALSGPLGGLICYEFLMQFRRKALWVAMLIAWGFVIAPIGHDKQNGLNVGLGAQLLLPLIAGYFLSDRLYRDHRLGTDQLIGTSGVGRGQYIWGKYLGVVGATLSVTCLVIAVLNLLLVPLDVIEPGENYFTLVFAPLTVIIPAYLFIGAFCVAVPVVLPLRLYQILFSCYWLWAFQGRFPSVYGTPLSPNGQFTLMLLLKDRVRQSFAPGADNWSRDGYFLIRGPFGWTFEDTPAMVFLNVSILLGLGLIALVTLRYLLEWKEAHW